MSLEQRLQEREAQRTQAIRDAIGDQIDTITANHNFGQPTAAKRGRNPKWPYVPVIATDSPLGPRTTQLRGLAYATRQEATQRAADQITSWRAQMAKDLAHPNKRAFREQHGLPRDPATDQQQKA